MTPMMSVARPAAFGQFFFVAVSFACLTYAFVQDDFSVLYVANHSQLALPTGYKVSAVWSAHEGSLLMWILILAAWTLAVAKYSSDIPAAFDLPGNRCAGSAVGRFPAVCTFDVQSV